MEIDRSKSKARIYSEIIYNTDSAGDGDSCRHCAYDSGTIGASRACIDGDCVDGVEEFLEKNPINIKSLAALIVRGGHRLYDHCDYCVFRSEIADADITEICRRSEISPAANCFDGVLAWLEKEGL